MLDLKEIEICEEFIKLLKKYDYIINNRFDTEYFYEIKELERSMEEMKRIKNNLGKDRLESLLREYKILEINNDTHSWFLKYLKR